MRDRTKIVGAGWFPPLICGLLLLGGCSESTETRPSSTERPATPIAAYEVKALDLSRQLRTSGLVEAREHARVHSRTSGNLLELAVDVGDSVSAGQTLARLDLAEQRAELARREQGLEPFDAVISACKVRLRPILMTTSTTVLGMLPLAIGLGEGAEIMRPLALTVVGGLLVSMLLTLVVIPSLYLVADKAAAQMTGWLTGRT